MPTAFEDWFHKATGQKPHPYQSQLAAKESLPRVWKLPTGSGKTATAVLTWLWRREKRNAKQKETTGRRLVYCLPMRVLVEQTQSVIADWLKNLGLEEKISVHLLMGGEDAGDWALYPEKAAILLGTQDMLISRALNRGYGASRARWPMEYGLLNNDALWIMDEVQLMGPSVDTSAQLAGFRKILSRLPNDTVWMSATIEPEWVETVDHPGPIQPFELNERDFSNDSPLGKVFHAKKTLGKIPSGLEPKALVQEIVKEHRQISSEKSGTFTLVVLNTVKRAKDFYEALKKNLEKEKQSPETLLIHSRFRPADREALVAKLLSPVPENGRIVIATQVIEAGVDISANLLFTDLAPWPSLVQRLGRLNRRGEFSTSKMIWMDLTEKEGKDRPYAWDELANAQSVLNEIESKGGEVGIDRLPSIPLIHQPGYTLRHRDLLELFDTTPDLAGQDIDISPYIREGEDRDVLVYWRTVDPEDDVPQEPSPPVRAELCAVPFHEFEKFKGKGENSEESELPKDIKIRAWNFDFLNGKWIKLGPKTSVYPGQTWLVSSDSGLYDPILGWNDSSRAPVPEIPHRLPLLAEEQTGDDPFSQQTGVWRTIAEHTNLVVEETQRILRDLELDRELQLALLQAARLHDLGKAHPEFQSRIKPESLGQFQNERGPHFAAKAPSFEWRNSKKFSRPFFRHELASALASIQLGESDLVAYLVAAHHGKVRLSIRSLPDESRPLDGSLYARGIWDGDWIPEEGGIAEVDLGGNFKIRKIRFDLSLMKIGLNESGKPSWIDRMTNLRDHHGCFSLAFLEAILRAADQRASIAEMKIVADRGEQS